MDILNWLYLRKNQLIRTTVNNANTDLVVLGADATFARRDDKYKTYAMTVEDFAAAVTLPPAYKVYTALLTQSGGDEILFIYNGLLTIGVTYLINVNDVGGDFTNVGAPNNNIGTSFVATGTTPNSWGDNINVELQYNTGAPVVTVLENTIGNVWFSYDGVGNYGINSDNLFTNEQTWITPLYSYDPENLYYYRLNFSASSLILATTDGEGDISFIQYPIEIRVYN